jgi:hypothetical protein
LQALATHQPPLEAKREVHRVDDGQRQFQHLHYHADAAMGLGSEGRRLWVPCEVAADHCTARRTP